MHNSNFVFTLLIHTDRFKSYRRCQAGTDLQSPWWCRDGVAMFCQADDSLQFWLRAANPLPSQSTAARCTLFQDAPQVQHIRHHVWAGQTAGELSHRWSCWHRERCQCCYIHATFLFWTFWLRGGTCVFACWQLLRPEQKQHDDVVSVVESDDLKAQGNQPVLHDLRSYKVRPRLGFWSGQEETGSLCPELRRWHRYIGSEFICCQPITTLWHRRWKSKCPYVQLVSIPHPVFQEDSAYPSLSSLQDALWTTWYTLGQEISQGGSHQYRPPSEWNSHRSIYSSTCCTPKRTLPWQEELPI